MTPAQFYANYEFEHEPVNGFNRPLNEDEIIELMKAYADYKNK